MIFVRSSNVFSLKESANLVKKRKNSYVQTLICFTNVSLIRGIRKNEPKSTKKSAVVP